MPEFEGGLLAATPRAQRVYDKVRSKSVLDEQLRKITKRLETLTPGRYHVILTVDKQGIDWTVQSCGKVER